MSLFFEKFTKNELLFQYFRRRSKIPLSHLRVIFVNLFTFPHCQFRFCKSSRGKVFIRKILSRLCLDPAMNKRDSALLERDNNVPASYKCNNNS